MSGKWLELLKEIAPRVERVAIMFNPASAPTGGSYFLVPFETAAASIAVKPIAMPVHSVADVEPALATLGREPGGGLIVMPDIFTTVNRGLIIAQAAQQRVPAIYSTPQFAADGGLIAQPENTGARAMSSIIPIRAVPTRRFEPPPSGGGPPH